MREHVSLLLNGRWEAPIFCYQLDQLHNMYVMNFAGVDPGVHTKLRREWVVLKMEALTLHHEATSKPTCEGQYLRTWGGYTVAVRVRWVCGCWMERTPNGTEWRSDTLDGASYVLLSKGGLN
jgi:hypothetical protein